jgi:hypothetical protein
VALGFGTAVWYEPLHNWIKCQTSRSTETHVWYVWGCQSFWNEAETILELKENVDMCHISSCDWLHMDGSVGILFPIFCAVLVPWPKILKWDPITSIAMLQVRASLKTLPALKSMVLQKNHTFNLLNCSMTQFYIVVPIQSSNYIWFFFTSILVPLIM